MRFLYKLVLLSVFVGSVAGASQGMSSAEKILQDLNRATHFQQFIQFSSPKTLPGDAVYINTVLKKNPELISDNSKPKISLDNGVLTLRVGKSAVTLKFKDPFLHLWEINGKQVTLYPSALAPERWKQIASAIQDRKTAHLALLPVAWAEAAGQPTATLLLAFLVTSAAECLDGNGARQTQVGNVKLEDLLSKVPAQSDEGCSQKAISEVSLAVGALAPTSISCTGGDFTTTFKDERGIRVVSIVKKGTKAEVIDKASLSALRGVTCQFQLPDWKSEKCQNDQARIEQLKAWVPKVVDSDFCSKCKPLIDSISAKPTNTKGKR